VDPSAGDEVVHAVEAAQKRALAATRWADQSGDLVAADVDADVAQRLKRPVVEVEIVDIEHRCGRGRGVLGLGSDLRAAGDEPRWGVKPYVGWARGHELIMAAAGCFLNVGSAVWRRPALISL